MTEVRVASEGGVATVTLERPDQRNAMSIALLERLVAVFGEFAARPDIRVVVLAGADPDFCAGMDFAELARARAGGPQDVLDLDRCFREALTAIAAHPVPVVARIQGRALGGGCQLVLACDLAVAEEGATLGIPSSRLGIVIPLDSVERLVLAVGPRRAAELLYTGTVISGVEAHAWGLVTRTARLGELDGVVATLVEQVATGAPLSVRASKWGIAAASHGSTGANERASEFERMAAAALAGEDLAEGIAAFREKRSPEFKGR